MNLVYGLALHELVINNTKKVQFKCRTLDVPNLIPIWVDPNDRSSTDDSDVENTWSHSIHFYDVQ